MAAAGKEKQRKYPHGGCKVNKIANKVKQNNLKENKINSK
jgi:hypothetical protein